MLLELKAYANKLKRLDRARRAPPGADELLLYHEKRWYLLAKAAGEWVLALGLFVLLAPVMLLASLLVRLTSRGPVLYAQTRVGQFGRPYTIYKVRTMYHDCERTSGPRWAVANDPRITPVGRLLRAIHMDELPQLWNVLRGEMSLVGPRPERPEFLPGLEQALPGYSLRLLVRPGLTGLAQVQLPADTDLNSVRRKLAYDLCYIRAMGPWLDLRIVVSTAFKMAGASFPVLRRLFLLPSEEAVERVYRDLTPRTSSVGRREVA